MNSRVTTEPSAPERLAEHFFRHQSGRLVATLTRVMGVGSLELVEDVVQGAFLQALRTWATRGVPDDPAGWLFRVARNLALDALRRERTNETKRHEWARGESTSDELLARVQYADEIADDQLRLLCLCCHPELPPESQVAFSLKMMGGFSTHEIARSLLSTEETVQKRIARAKARLREVAVTDVSGDDLVARRPLLLNAIYLIFNEGYYSSRADRLIRVDMCAEALRLGALVAGHPDCRTPDTCALLGLMYLHFARFKARENVDGRLVLMEEQDRDKWDRQLIGVGLRWMWDSGTGNTLSPYHLEAGIAAEHCTAPKFADTDWPRILELYNLLVALRPTAVNRLNRGIAVAYVRGPLAGLKALSQIEPSELPPDYYFREATIGELHRRAGNLVDARRHLLLALEITNSPQEQELLRTRLATIVDETTRD